jgi:hypothetical protein
MKAKREVLVQLLHHIRNLQSDPELLAQAAHSERALDRETRRYVRNVQRNEARIRRMLSDAESYWTFGDQQPS